MSTFEVKVVQVDDVQKHPNADKLTMNRIGGYIAISNLKEDGTPRYAKGDLVVYIPEGAVLPEALLKQMGFWNDAKGVGMLAGSKGDRVKALKLRNILSQGVILPVLQEVVRPGFGGSYHYIVRPKNEKDDPVYVKADGTVNQQVLFGEDVAEQLGITKYEPEIPVAMAGEVRNVSGSNFHYDVENLKKFPNVFVEGEEVVMTEKLHGTFAVFGQVIDHESRQVVDRLVSSKGLFGKGLAFKDNEANVNNLYMRVAKDLNIFDKMSEVGEGTTMFILGEIYGKGVQDLTYGTSKPTFAVFDIMVSSHGAVNQGLFLGYDAMVDIAKTMGLDVVPTLYRGAYSQAVVDQHTKGLTVAGEDAHIREGVVIKPVPERVDSVLGRVMLKSVSEDYLLRKGGTEFN